MLTSIYPLITNLPWYYRRRFCEVVIVVDYVTCGRRRLREEEEKGEKKNKSLRGEREREEGREEKKKQNRGIFWYIYKKDNLDILNIIKKSSENLPKWWNDRYLLPPITCKITILPLSSSKEDWLIATRRSPFLPSPPEFDSEVLLFRLTELLIEIFWESHLSFPDLPCF